MLNKALITSTMLALLSLSGPALAADVAISDDARAHFTAGVNFMQDPDGARYEEAYREFKAAYAASPSWKILGNLGIAAFKLERDGEAIDAFSRYLKEGGSDIDPDERAQFERDLQTLQSAASTITLRSTPAGMTIVDERFPASGSPILNRYGPSDQELKLGLRAGHHRFTAKHDGFPDVVWEADLEPRQQVEHTFEFKAAPAAPPPTTGAAVDTTVKPESGGNGLRTASYVVLGVGVVGLGVGTFFGLQAKSKYEEGNDLCPSFPCSLTQEQADDREQLGKDGDSAKTISLVGFIAGGVGIAAGATMFFLSGSSKKETAAKVTPWVGLNSAGVRGSF